MSLPVIATPKFELTLPSTGKKYKYRPFLVKEEKVLLIALESGNTIDIINAVKEVIISCVIGIKIGELSTFDLEYVFLRLREKSISDIVSLIVKHPDGKNSKGEKCDESKTFEIKLSDVNVTFNEKNSKKIQLTDDVGVVMKYPSFDSTNISDDLTTDAIFKVIQESIDYIYDKENTYPAKEHKPEEIKAFIESLSHKQMELIEEFFTTMPKVEYTINWKCDKCGCEETITLSGLNDFFM